MKVLTTATLAAAVIAMSALPALADDRSNSRSAVSYKALTAYCAKVKPDSRSFATLVGRDGKKVSGWVHCETDYSFRARSHHRSGDDDGHRRGRDDDRWDDDRGGDDDRWDD